MSLAALASPVCAPLVFAEGVPSVCRCTRADRWHAHHACMVALGGGSGAIHSTRRCYSWHTQVLFMAQVLFLLVPYATVLVCTVRQLAHVSAKCSVGSHGTTTLQRVLADSQPVGGRGAGDSGSQAPRGVHTEARVCKAACQ